MLSIRSCHAALVLSITLGCACPAWAADFRVLPYQQLPTNDGMTINWFTEQNLGGTLTVTGGDLPSALVYNSSPVAPPLLQGYSTNERNDAAAHGYELFEDGNWKHSIAVGGLTPGTTYQYAVSQGSSVFNGSLKIAPTAQNWSHVRFVALADSETDPDGVAIRRGWSDNLQSASSVGRPAGFDGQYLLTETVGYQQNLRIINSRNADLVLMPGDLVQGGGFQQAWDEFWRHNAGSFDTTFSDKPLLPAYGNWENYGGSLNNGYGNSSYRTPVARGRHIYKDYFDLPGNGTAEHQDNYYRVDYGPVTIITLDSSNGLPDQTTRGTGTELDTDTQVNFTAAEYAASVASADPRLGLTNDLSDFNPGSAQYAWAQQQIEEARANGQIVFVQWHHAPYSSGTHGFAMDHPDSSGQGGTPMQQYHPMFEALGVVAVFSGHSEMFERSFVDEDGDGVGVQYYDVGVAGDGLRGRAFDSVTGKVGGQNPFSAWSADADEAELWQEMEDGLGGLFTQLIDGGRHYGHLEVNIEKLDEPGLLARVTLTPVYSFPLVDVNGDLIGGVTERRIYGDELTLTIADDGSILPEPTAITMLGLLGAVLPWRRRRRQ